MRALCATILLLLCLHSYAQQRLYLVAGQSNARGRGDASLSPVVDTLTALEYHPGLNQLIHLQDPVGQTASGFQQADDGSPWPAFGKQYYSLTADTTVLVQAARGGSGVHPSSIQSGLSWSQSGLLYTLCAFKVNQAQVKSGLNLDGIVWLQGETDAIAVNNGIITQNDYRDALIVLIDRFRMSYGCHLPFYIILVGTDTADPPMGYDAVRAAQEEVAAIHPHTYLIHETTVNFPAMGWMSDDVHYSQEGYNDVGTVGATNLVDIENLYYSIAVNGSTTICPDDSVQLSAPPIYTAYQWSNGETTPDIYADAPGTYSVTVTDDNGCLFPLREIEIEQAFPQIPPVILMVGDNPLCFGDALTLGVRLSPGYLWSNGDTTQNIFVTTPGDYYVQTIDEYGCVSDYSDTVSISIEGNMPPLIIANGPTVFCEGEEVMLSAPAGFNAYNWSNGDTTQTTIITTSGTFTCMVTNANDCESVPSIPITTQMLPASSTPTITADGETLICENDSVTLSAPPGYTAYLWSDGSTTQNITIDSTGTFSCVVTGLNGCTSEAADPVTVLVFPNPPTPVITADSPTAFCAGESVVLSAPIGYETYQWSNGDTTQTIVVSNSGTFTCVVTNENGCASPVSFPMEITTYPIQATPSIAANGATTFCDGDSVLLSAPLGFAAYQWSNGESTQSIVVYDSGVYSCYITNSFGCQSPPSVPISVTVNPIPSIPEITVNGALTFCGGDSVELSASPGYATYDWSNGETTQNITVYNSGIFSCAVTDFNGCTSAVSAAVSTTMNPIPEAPSIAINGATTFCSGESTELSLPAGFELYLWSNGLTTSSITVSTSGVYDCTVTDANGCTTAAFSPVSITVNPSPLIPLIQTNGPTTFCEGDSVVLNVAAGFDYLWSNGEATQSIAVYDSGIYVCTITNAFGCSRVSDIVNTIMNPLPPQPVLAFSGSTEFCQGDSVIIFAPTGYTYQWSSGETTQNIIVDNTAGPITCTITNSNGCTAPASEPVFVTVNPLPPIPVIDTIGFASFCAGGTTILQAPSGYDTYFWNTGAMTSEVEVMNTGTYSVSVQDANGCVSPLSEPVDIFVNPIPATPIIIANSSTSFCEGDNVILTAPAGYVSYLWNNGATTQSIIIEETGTFTCMVTDNNGCESPISTAVNTLVNANPLPPVVNVMGDTILCAGDSLVLSATSGFVSYFWSNGALTQDLIVDEAGEYSYYVIDDNGCQSPFSIPVTVEIRPDPPVPDIVSSDNLSFCENDSITLFADAGYQSYLWSTGDTTESIVVNTEDEFFYVATDSVSCENSVSGSVFTTVRPVPPKPEVYVAGTDSLCADVLANNYLWLLNDTLVSGLNTPCIVPDISGYWRVIAVANGCPSQVSDSLYFELPIPPPNPDDPKVLGIYPNPNNGFLTIETTNILEVTAVLQVYDVLGQVLYEEVLEMQQEPRFSHTIDIRYLPDAAYFVVLRGGASGSFVRKLIVDR